MAAAHVALKQGREFLEKHSDEDVEMICYAIHSEQDLAAYDELMQVYFPL